MGCLKGVDKTDCLVVGVIIKEVRVGGVPRDGIVLSGVWVRTRSEGDWDGGEEVIFRDVIEVIVGRRGSDCGDHKA